MKFLKAKFFLSFIVLITQYPVFSDITAAQEELLLKLPPDQRDSIEAKMYKSNEMEEELDKIFSKDNNIGSYVREMPFRFLPTPPDTTQNTSKNC